MSRFAIFPATVYDDDRLSPGLRDLLGLISTYADREGWCWPSQGLMAAQLGQTREAINRKIQHLSNFGYLLITRRRGSSTMRLVYDLPLTSDRRVTSDVIQTSHLDVIPGSHRTTQGNGPKEGPRKPHRLPDGWVLPEAARQWVVEHHPSVDIDMELQRFVLHWSNTDRPSARKLDWAKAFQSWILNGVARYGTGTKSQPPRHQRGGESSDERRRKLAHAVGDGDAGDAS